MSGTDWLQWLDQRRPDEPVFSDARRSLSVAELRRQADTLAACLHAMGLGGDAVVATCLARGIDAALGVYGIVRAGACYVPLQPGCPAERNRFILADAGCRCVLVNEPPPVWLVETGITILDIHTLNRAPEGRPGAAVDPEQAAAILYTSGSTGRPKGVVLSRRAIAAFADWAIACFGLDEQDRIANLAPFNFDLSLFDLFAAPAAGATTCFIPEALKLSPSRLIAWLRDQKITTWYTVPSMLGLISLKGGLGEQGLPDLRRLLFAGEVFPTAGLKRLSGLLPDTRLYNLFGPTETNVCLYWPVEPAQLERAQPIPIGRPACAAELRISPQRGELLVRGPCLLSGYRQAGRTVSALDADGWYHSGDRVSRDAAGDYAYHGRLDRMLKSAGYRIEPAEVERVLASAPGVDAAAVVGIPDPLSGTRIAAAVSGAGLSRARLHRHAGAHLAAWMRPSFYLIVADLPLLANGKVDYPRITRRIAQELSQ